MHAVQPDRGRLFMKHFDVSFDAYSGVTEKLSESAIEPRPVVSIGVGYRPRNAAVHRIYNLLVALAIMPVALPVIAVISALLFLTQGTGIFYRGERLGLGRRPFQIYKFRTLDTARAETLTSDRVLPRMSGLETPLGKFLRTSRLDELPQLFNVLRGDMNICGPRPVRPAIALQQERIIPNYHQRFLVKPGLVGMTQAFMSHSTSKRLRARFNNTLCVNEVRYGADLGVFLRVGLCVARRTVQELRFALGPRAARVRAEETARLFDVCLEDEETGRRLPAAGIDADGLYLDRSSDLPAVGNVWIRFTTARGGQRRFRATLSPALAEEDRWLVPLEPVTDVGNYLLERYLLNAVVVPAPRPEAPPDMPSGMLHQSADERAPGDDPHLHRKPDAGSGGRMSAGMSA